MGHCRFSHGDPTGYGYHAGSAVVQEMSVYGLLTRCSIDFINGWDKGVLQKAVDNCHCNAYGDVSRSSSTCPSRFL